MSDDLIEFLRARLDETARKAQAARPRPDDSTAGHWVAYPHRPTSPMDDPTRNVHLVGCQEPDGREWVVAETGQGDRASANAAHVAEHDPARVLREVEAKRRMAELCSPPLVVCPSPTGETEYIPGEGEPWGLDVLKLLALPYADHPDYRKEWRP